MLTILALEHSEGIAQNGRNTSLNVSKAIFVSQRFKFFMKVWGWEEKGKHAKMNSLYLKSSQTIIRFP